MKNIAVFASGNGSNFQAILDAVTNQKLDADIKLLVCDQPGAYVLDRARAAGINIFEFSSKDFANKQAYEQEILARLKECEVELVVLAGYMRIIGTTLLSQFEGQIVNIHPSLLPSFPGKDAIGQALAARVKVSGVTVHFVDEGMDTGPIIAQETVELDGTESAETYQEKIHQVEHQLYPAVLQMLLSSSRRNVK
ncbi:phosphoribosylglycinamide formyltransferase [Bacillus sp. 1NLA3E]|uniref:phosphoribosylglycinamide formyltransferase n=1 Tax=Bacillus sp. 1NLA3E TaxID=666686 RepID=UPI000247EB30|nr:phosphoribosylglycinamide formyltransferase [Bacillus sp. 1NLA3E]AGK52101.1 phosphoribosylglycinamide formyltransferase [Bacillus sp. 1NLA3E]